MAEQPATTAVIVLCVAIWLRIKSKDYGNLEVVTSYKEALDTKHGTWRLRVFQIVHLDFVHLLFNMLGCWGMGFIEMEHGTWNYITMSAVMLELVALVQLAAWYIMVHVRKEAGAQSAMHDLRCGLFWCVVRVADCLCCGQARIFIGCPASGSACANMASATGVSVHCSDHCAQG
jgi:hypothetical protein